MVFSGDTGVVKMTNISSSSGIGSSSREMTTSELSEQGEQGHVLHGNILIQYIHA